MAKTKKETDAAQGIERHPVTREIINLVLPFPDASTHEEAAANHFYVHPEYKLDKVVVADDLTIFPGSAKGENAAENYCVAEKIGYKVIER
jgi:hypothetical protein